jgi:sterol-4alpha-carboxylate 3-dehydrogenase (decarboxylating)
VISSWNTTVKALRSLCQGNDWSFFFKVVFVLLALSLAGAISLHSIFVIGLPIAFLAFLVYEKKEQEIDSIVVSFKSFACKHKSDVYEKLFGSKKHD